MVLVIQALIEVDDPADVIAKRKLQLFKSKFLQSAEVTDDPDTVTQVDPSSGDIWSETVEESNVPVTTICPVPPYHWIEEDSPLTLLVITCANESAIINSLYEFIELS